MQDIAGCRIVVAHLMEQQHVVERIARLFGEAAKVVDRRAKPSHGYRAVHMILNPEPERSVEVQVRTAFQQRWAELSELLADRYGQDVKYGGGPADVQTILMDLSSSISAFEEEQDRLHRALARDSKRADTGELDQRDLQAYAEWAEAIAHLADGLASQLGVIMELHRRPRGNQ